MSALICIKPLKTIVDEPDVDIIFNVGCVSCAFASVLVQKCGAVEEPGTIFSSGFSVGQDG